MHRCAPKILLIDDDELFGAILARVAKEGGISLTHITSPGALPPKFIQRAFNFLVIDYELQNVTGPQVVKSLEEFLCTLPTILVTSYGKLPSSLSLPASILRSLHKSEGPQKILLAAISIYSALSLRATK